jgi:rhamnulokinase
MAAPAVAAIDLGAGSGRVVVARREGDRLALTEVHRFETPLVRDPATGYLCWDLDGIEAQLGRGLDLARAQGPLAGVGVDGWGVDYVLLDGERRRVGPAVSYRDGRTEGAPERVFRRMSAEAVYRRTGIGTMAINTLFQLAQTAEVHPEWLERARHLLMVPDYLHHRLGGALANEYTEASTTQMLDAAARDWDPELLALAGLDRLRPDRPVPPGTILAEAATPFGAGAPLAVVAPASHDTAAAVAAIPFDDDAEVFISSGSWSLMGFPSPVAHATPQAMGLGFSSEGGADGRYLVLKNIVGLLPVQQLAREWVMDHGALAEAAAAAPPWTALIDPGDGRFLHGSAVGEAIRSFCAQTGQAAPEGAGPMARCVLDSLALAYLEAKEEIEALRQRPVSGIRIVGGGSRNRLLNQLCADACQVRVQAGPAETSALGNACLQMLALGLLDSRSQAHELIRRSQGLAGFRPGDPVPEPVRRRFRSLRKSGVL